MDTLGPYIYHERQEQGSMMCGQHALNSLLQGNYFTAPDLASIARELDELERGVNERARGGRSTNMDDTGYFSVQVLENALQNTFGLTLTRWRSAEMREFQAHPEAQLAFVLNLEQHWFTLRRFGQRQGKGFWFNLNSFLSAPEWVGSTYLGMVLQQAEEEGYSVFVVRPSDPMNAEHGLPETEADILAETLDESSQSAPHPSGSGLIGTGAGGRAGTGGGVGGSRSTVPGLEDEDLELQRALQASLGAGYGGTVYDFPDETTGGSGGGFGSARGSGGRYGQTSSASESYASRAGGSLGLGYGGDRPPSRRTPPVVAPDPPVPIVEEIDTSDPVAASAARGRARLEQMQREQQAAMHAMGTSGYGFGAGMDEAVDEDAARRRREAADRVRRAREEEDEQIRLAMAESLRTHTAGSSDNDTPEYFVTPPTTSAALPGGDRHYDDEDAELQAALKASLEESGGQGVTIPSEPVVAPRQSGAQTNPVPSSGPVPRPAPIPVGSAAEEDDEDDEDDEEEEESAPAPAAKAEVADADEVRRRRLARFGG